jgi:hypothetical protein
LWVFCNENPTYKLGDYRFKLLELGYDCNRDYIRAIFKEWKWSWKRPSFKQLQKYTPENMGKYAAYVAWIAMQDLTKMKFMDEVHFVSKGMLYPLVMWWYSYIYNRCLTKQGIRASR